MKINGRIETVRVTLTNCVRCGQEHSGLKFTRFADRPIFVGGSTNCKFNYWGMCPNFNEPVLLDMHSRITSSQINEAGIREG